MKQFEPPIFPPWHGKLLSPLIDTRQRDIDIARKRGGLLVAVLASGLLWIGIAAAGITIIRAFWPR